jgi:hypothetical protein
VVGSSAGSLTFPGTLVRQLLPAKAIATDGISPPHAPCQLNFRTEGGAFAPVIFLECDWPE